MGHIELGKWADLVILAPATADLLARVAAGMANNLLTTVCLATDAPIAAAPAMNQQMYRAAATQANLQTLQARGMLLWGPDSGSQACGDVGPGRMLDPLDIVELANGHFSAPQESATFAGYDHRRPDARSAGSGAFHQQSQLRQNGLRHRPRRRRPRRAGDADRRAGEPADAAIGHPSGRHQRAGDGTGGATARRAAADFHLLRRRG